MAEPIAHRFVVEYAFIVEGHWPDINELANVALRQAVFPLGLKPRSWGMPGQMGVFLSQHYPPGDDPVHVEPETPALP